MPAATRRRSRHDTPAWAEKILGDNPGPAEFDRVENHRQARALHPSTDPDTIEDPGVRDAFLEQANDDVDEHDRRRGRGGSGGGAPAPVRAAARSWSVPGSFGRAVAGAVAYAVLINFVRGGPAQVGRWFAAKFTNGDGRLA